MYEEFMSQLQIDELPVDIYVSTRRAAILLGTTADALRKHRSRGTGPEFTKRGYYAEYRISDLAKYEDERDGDVCVYETDGTPTMVPWRKAGEWKLKPYNRGELVRLSKYWGNVNPYQKNRGVFKWLSTLLEKALTETNEEYGIVLLD